MLSNCCFLYNEYPLGLVVRVSWPAAGTHLLQLCLRIYACLQQTHSWMVLSIAVYVHVDCIDGDHMKHEATHEAKPL